MFSQPLFAIERMRLSNLASSAPGSLPGSWRNSESCATKSFSVAATARLFPLFALLNAASRMSTIRPSPSLTASAICGAQAVSRIAGFLMISASAMTFLSFASILRIASPGLFTVTSPTIVSSEKTRLATKSLMPSMPPMSRGTVAIGPGTGGGIAFTTLSMSPVMGALTTNSPSPSPGFSSGTFATFSSIAFISSGSPALSLTSLSWYASSFALVSPTSSPSMARSAISTRMPVL